jgi:microcystin-dependent protein
MSTPIYYETKFNFSGNTTLTPPSSTDLGLSLVPIGSILLYGGVNLPINYFWCDGATYSTMTYSKLFSAIGYTYGGSGFSFNVPNMSSRIPIGASTNSNMTIIYQGNSVKSGGNSFMNSNQLASHTHNPATSNSTGFITSGNTYTVSLSNTPVRIDFPPSSTTGDVTGGTGAEFLPPFTVVNYIIKYQ